MKGKALLVSVLALLMLLTFIAPVLAAEKVPASFSTSGAVTDLSGATINTTPSGIMHVNGALRTATATITFGGITYTGSIRVDLNFVVNPIKGTTTQYYHKMTITFPVQTGLSEIGVFEGVFTWTAEVGLTPGSIIPATMESHAVLQGSGGFEGYTFHFGRDLEKGVICWMLIH